jgi:THAP domain
MSTLYLHMLYEVGICCFSFTTHAELWKKWTCNVRRERWTPTNASHLCLAHFTDDCFNHTGQTIRLLQGSLPTGFNFPAHLQPGPVAPRKPPVLRDLGNIPFQSAKDYNLYRTSCKNASLNVKLDHCYASSPHKLKRQISDISEELDHYIQGTITSLQIHFFKSLLW